MITDEILVKYIVGEAEAHEVAMVEQWRKLDMANEKHLQQFKTLWTESAAVKNHTKVNSDKAWQKVQQRIRTEVKPKAKLVIFNSTWLMAASFALLLGIGVFFFNRNANTKETMLTAIIKDSVQNLVLADGSKIIVREGAFTYPQTFEGSKRKVILKTGQAFFDIAPNKEKPFEITTENTTITVLGTEFEINSNIDITEVKVREGKVRFNTPKGEIILTAGMGAQYNRKTNLLEKLKPESKNTFAYVTGELHFENETLKEVIKDLNQFYHGTHIELENKALENCKITSSFNHDSLETVLNVIALTLNLEIEHTNGSKTILIKGMGCSE